MVIKKFVNKISDIISIYKELSSDDSKIKELIDYIDNNGISKFMSILTLSHIDCILKNYKNELIFFNFSKKTDFSKMLTKLLTEIYNKVIFSNAINMNLINQILYPVVLTHLIDDYENKYVEFIEKLNSIDINFYADETNKQEDVLLILQEKENYKFIIINNFIILFLFNLIEKYNKIFYDSYLNNKIIDEINTDKPTLQNSISILYYAFKHNENIYEKIIL